MNKGYRKKEILHPQPKKALQGLGSLGEPVSAIVGATITGGMAIYSAIGNYNKAVEAERAADENKWDVNKRLFIERFALNYESLAKEELKLVDTEILLMQNGLGYVLPSEMQDPYNDYKGVGAKNITELIEALYSSLNFISRNWNHVHKTYGQVRIGFYEMVRESILLARKARAELRLDYAKRLYVACKIDDYMFKKIINHKNKATIYNYDRNFLSQYSDVIKLPDEQNISDAELETELQLLRPQKQCMIENGAIVQTGSGTGPGGRSEASVLGSEFYKNKNFQIGAAVVGGTLVVGTALYFIFRPKPTV